VNGKFVTTLLSILLARRGAEERRHGRFVTILLLILLSVLPATSPVYAHPLDEANLYHFFSCDLTADALTIDYRLLVGGLSVYKIWDAMDLDHNKVLSEEEKQTFAHKIQGALTATLDGRPLPLTLDSCTLPGYEDFIAGSAPFLQFTLKAAWALRTPGPHTLIVTSRVFPELSNLYPRATLNAPDTLAAKNTTVTGQKGFTLRFVTALRESGASAAPFAAAAAPVQEGGSPAAQGEPGPAEKQTPSKTSASSPQSHTPKSDVQAGSAPSSPYVWMDAAMLSALRAAFKLQQERQERANAQESGHLLPPPARLSDAAVSAPSSLPPQTLPAAPTAPLAATAPAGAVPPPPAPARTLRLLRPFLMGRGGLLAALCLAVLLGAAHALLPGHSKAVVGAYLVGSRGTVGDAVFLGGVVTLAHTGVVLLFGLLMWKLERFAPERVQPWLQVASGGLIALLGIGLFLRGLLRWYGVGVGEEDRSAESGAGIGDGVGSADAFAYVPRSRSQHRRQGKARLLSLGLAGGIVPCGDALILLLFAHAQHRTALGLLLVTAFGFGMAAVLMGIGIALVTTGGLISRFSNIASSRLWSAVPLFSALVITALGLWLSWEALLSSRLILLNF
jgi:nickel/cobalt exporter